jgi:hypothetical protein
MFLGPIPQRRNISDRQFTGDLISLFARHRIAPGTVCAFANFRSRFALSDSFRSQLFALCNAISHLSEVDLTGDQLLTLISCALNSTEVSDPGSELPERVRAEFELGYGAWNARNLDLRKADEWQTRPQPTDFDPVPLTKPVKADVERAGLGVAAPGTIRFQGPHDIAPRMSALQPQAVAGVDLEHLTLDELTRLLEKIEHRIGRLKPHIRPLVGAATELDQTSSAAVEQVARTVPRSVQIDDAFLARHAYLTPGRCVVSADRALQIAPSSAIALEGLMHAASPAVANSAGSPPLTEAASKEKTLTTNGLCRLEAPKPPRDQGPTSVNQRAGRSRLSLSKAIGAFTAAVMIVIIAGGLAAIVLCPSAVATYFNRPSSLGPKMEKSAEITLVAANPVPLASAPAKSTRRGTNALTHRAFRRILSSAQSSRPKPAAVDGPPQPQ